MVDLAKMPDLDLNPHVGNVKYIEHVLETIPMDIMQKYRVNLIYIKYNKELIYNEKIKVEREVHK